MKALTIIPTKADSFQLRDVPAPTAESGSSDLLCQMLGIGICGTDKDIAKGSYGEAPEGSEFLIIGHESLGRVLETSSNSKFKKGDLVVGIVRRPDPVPCPNCAVGEWDMCQNGRYTERGIKGLHGYASEQFKLNENYAVKIDSKLGLHGVLLEPTSIVAKAWQQIMLIKSRSKVRPQTALITGAGPVGQLAAMMGIQQGLNVHILDHNTEGPKVEAALALGVTYHSDIEAIKKSSHVYDIIMECTGVSDLILQAIKNIKPDGVVCLTGISTGGRCLPVDIGQLNLNIVLQNELIFGSVNANRNHYALAAQSLASADPRWLDRLITRKIPLSRWKEAFEKQKSDIKVVLVPDTAH